MVRFLFAAFPVSGHVNPGLPVARDLVARGHSVRRYSTQRLRRPHLEVFRHADPDPQRRTPRTHYTVDAVVCVTETKENRWKSLEPSPFS